MKTITIKANGNSSAKPDTTVVNLTLESLDLDYNQCFNKASDAIAKLNEKLEKVGFKSETLKTINFNVDAIYDNVPDQKGNYQKVFRGYRCYHFLELEFNFNQQKLSEVINAINESKTQPRINLSFIVKDYDKLINAAIKDATAAASAKAKILCEASGSKLGSLISINYDWKHNRVLSPSSYNLHSDRLAQARVANLNFTPDQIEVSEPVTFIWEIITK